MPLSLHWLGEESFDRIADARLYCYAPGMKEQARFRQIIREDRRAEAGDYLIAQKDQFDVGTATALSMSMWVRGGCIPCQAVAWVGTAQTHRRRSSSPDGGVASQIMREVLRRGRERGQVVSALMPFRASFYEHFGYGLVEKRSTWNIPLSILPHGDCDGMRFYQPGDREELSRCRQRIVESGQCDIERTSAGWDYWFKRWEDGFVIVDRQGEGPIHGYLCFQRVQENAKDGIKSCELGYEDVPSLLRMLCFLATLRDQFSFAAVTLPAEIPLNWLLRETQLPHRPVNHPHAVCQPFTRMQLRVLDHKRLIESMSFDPRVKGKINVAVHETAGDVSRFCIDLGEGRASATPATATPDLECTDRVWSAIATGGLLGMDALRLKLIECLPAIARLMNCLSDGPSPFCEEYF